MIVLEYKFNQGHSDEGIHKLRRFTLCLEIFLYSSLRIGLLLIHKLIYQVYVIGINEFVLN